MPLTHEIYFRLTIFLIRIHTHYTQEGSVFLGDFLNKSVSSVLDERDYRAHVKFLRHGLLLQHFDSSHSIYVNRCVNQNNVFYSPEKSNYRSIFKTIYLIVFFSADSVCLALFSPIILFRRICKSNDHFNIYRLSRNVFPDWYTAENMIGLDWITLRKCCLQSFSGERQEILGNNMTMRLRAILFLQA